MVNNGILQISHSDFWIYNFCEMHLPTVSHPDNAAKFLDKKNTLWVSTTHVDVFQSPPTRNGEQRYSKNFSARFLDLQLFRTAYARSIPPWCRCKISGQKKYFVSDNDPCWCFSKPSRPRGDPQFRCPSFIIPLWLLHIHYYMT